MSIYTSFLLGAFLGFFFCLVLPFLLVYLAHYFGVATTRFRFLRIGLLFLLLPIVTFACYAENSTKVSTSLLLLLIVFIIGRSGGKIAGVAASLGAALLFALFLPPSNSLQIALPGDRQSAVVFVLSTLIVGVLSSSRDNGSDRNALPS